MPSLSELSQELKVKLLEAYLATPSNLKEENISDLLKNFPFPFPEKGMNPNYLALKVLRARKELVDHEYMAKRLGLSIEDVDRLLNGDSVEILFPVSNGRETFINRALLITDLSSPFAPDGVEKEVLETISKLSGRGFLLVFERGFNISTRSFMLAVYAGLVWGSKVSNIAFTGVLSPEGRIEETEYLISKIEKSRVEGCPLLFPSPSMSDIESLKKFIDELIVPIAALPGHSGELFLRGFPFPPDYIKEVFHLENPLTYTQAFDDSPESFEKFKEWLDFLARELKTAFENFLKFEIAITSNPLIFSFYAGTCLTKTRIPVRFLAYDNENKTYREVFRLENDKPIQTGEELHEVFKVKEAEEIRSIFIGTKSKSLEEGTLSLIFKNPLIDEQKSHLYAYIAAGYLRSQPTACPRIIFETPNSFAFALGYFLEDFKCLALVHKGRVVHRIGGKLTGKLYLLNAFSLSMLPYKRAFVEVERITTQEALDLLKNNPWESYISHKSTAEVLSEFLGTKVRMKRENLTLKPGDRALVFQVEVRPKEGQVFSEEEISQIIAEKLFSFRLVRVL